VLDTKSLEVSPPITQLLQESRDSHLPSSYVKSKLWTIKTLVYCVLLSHLLGLQRRLKRCRALYRCSLCNDKVLRSMRLSCIISLLSNHETLPERLIRLVCASTFFKGC
jgi:hypothetical protein